MASPLVSFLLKFRLIKPRYILRRHRIATAILGPVQSHSRDHIELNITEKCNLRCYNCDMSCRQAPSAEDMTVDQVVKFIEESKAIGKKWKRIRLLGGEPTLHPQIHEIVALILAYKSDFAPDCLVQIASNGHGKKVQSILAEMPEGIEVDSTDKDGNLNHDFSPFNIAPRDCLSYRGTDYRNGCFIMTETCGMGLSRSGYYQCIVASGLDRVVGYDNGRKSIPAETDELDDLKEVYCQICGHYRITKPKDMDKEIQSPFWQETYAYWKKSKPELSKY
ncbi:MAG: radical SAM protein [Desulfobulbaceae bacterium]|nr:MAG: radical SAM protein [Desulfobulbaceae bacterium]